MLFSSQSWLGITGVFMNKCINCDKETTNPKFCSSSCSATYNNKLVPRRKLEGNCVVCNKPITKKAKYCSDCFKSDANPKYVDWSKVTIGEDQSKRSYQINSRIRNLARRLYHKSNRKQGCAL